MRLGHVFGASETDHFVVAASTIRAAGLAQLSVAGIEPILSTSSADADLVKTGLATVGVAILAVSRGVILAFADDAMAAVQEKSNARLLESGMLVAILVSLAVLPRSLSASLVLSVRTASSAVG